MENDSFIFNEQYRNDRIAFLVSFGILLTFILCLSLIEDKESKVTCGIVFGVYNLIVLIIYFTGFTIYNSNTGENNRLKIISTGLFGATFEIHKLLFDRLMGKKEEDTGASTNPGMTLDSLGNRYGGGMTQIKNLGKGDSGSLILNYFRVNKRGSILPCDSKTGTCKVKRSVVYMIIYLSIIVLTPIFITLGEMGDNSFDISKMMGYLNLFLAVTFGIVLVLVLGTIKDAGGSDVFNVTPSPTPTAA